jgi:hypothetical protein
MTRELTERGFLKQIIALWKKTSKGTKSEDYTRIRCIKNKDWVVKPPIFVDQTCNKPFNDGKTVTIDLKILARHKVVHHLDERGQNNSSITKGMIL